MWRISNVKMMPQLKICSVSEEMKPLKGDARVQTGLSHWGRRSSSLPTGNPLADFCLPPSAWKLHFTALSLVWKIHDAMKCWPVSSWFCRTLQPCARFHVTFNPPPSSAAVFLTFCAGVSDLLHHHQARGRLPAPAPGPRHEGPGGGEEDHHGVRAEGHRRRHRGEASPQPCLPSE